MTPLDWILLGVASVLWAVVGIQFWRLFHRRRHRMKPWKT